MAWQLRCSERTGADGEAQEQGMAGHKDDFWKTGRYRSQSTGSETAQFDDRFVIKPRGKACRCC